MKASQSAGKAFRLAVGVAVLVLAGCSSMPGGGSHRVAVNLSGAEEVPAVATSAHASGTIVVGADHAVSGSVTTSGLGGVAAHIHTGAKGKNGPVSVGLVKTANDVWSVPAGARFNDAQYQSFLAGELYVNVHTPAHKGGEIRGQLMP